MYRLKQAWDFISENRWILFQFLFLLYLLVLSWMDIRSRKLSLWLLLAGIPASVISGIFAADIPAVLLTAGGAVGILFLIISRSTGEAFGYGDSILITISGIFLGIWDLLSMLVTAFFLAAVFSGIMLAGKRYTRRSSFPFVPFLTAAYMGGALIGGYG